MPKFPLVAAFTFLAWLASPAVAESLNEAFVSAYSDNLKFQGIKLELPTLKADAFNAVLLKAPADLSFKHDYGMVYGKVMFRLGSKLTNNEKAKATIQQFLKQAVGGSETSTFSLVLTIQKDGADVIKAVLGTGTATSSNIFGIEISSQFSEASTTAGILARGLVVNSANNTMAAKLELTRSDKITFNMESATKAAEAYKALSVVKLVPVATNLTPGLNSALQLAALFFPSEAGSNQQITVPLQFITIDGFETEHVFTRGGTPIATVSFMLEDTIFASQWDRLQTKFIRPNADLIWSQSMYSPTGKHVVDLLRDDLPTTVASAKAIKKFITDLDADALTPMAKLEEAQKQAVGSTCESVYDALQKYFTVPDAAAVYWALLDRYSTILRRDNAAYMERCLPSRIKDAFNRYGLTTTGLLQLAGQ